MDNNNETIRYDCSRGCVVTRDETGASECSYRQGCCKLEVYDWLKGVGQEQYKDFFEVRFKNTRKGIYRNDSNQTIKTGDLVIVEAATGHDLGIVTLEGPAVARQMVCKRIPADPAGMKKIYRKAKLFDIEKWQEAISREHETMIRSRQIAAELGLEMKIGDVEFQGDGTKAIFYYIADGRVDFRQLIKVFAEQFRIRIEMKQIGARQEAGLIGGLGVCGRELCCSNYISSFQSISTSAARAQDLSLNPQKLAGQCGKLKCCLNYETASYIDAQSRIPRVNGPLDLEDGQAWLMKTDILRETMYFSYEQGSLANLHAVPASLVREILRDNREGIKGPSLIADAVPSSPEFISAVGDDSISRFDDNRRKGRGGRGRGGRDRQGDRDRKNRERGSEHRGEGRSGDDRRGEGRRSDDRRVEGRRGDERRGEGRRGERGGGGERGERGERSERGERGGKGNTRTEGENK